MSYLDVALLVMTDGRRYCIERTIPSALDHLRGPVTRLVIHDDSGDPEYQDWLRERFSAFELITTPGRSGFGGAIQSAWSRAAAWPESYVFHLEDDFTFNRDVDVAGMAGLLKMNGHLAQVALRRQPWNEQERAAGGIVEQYPADYEEKWLWAMHRGGPWDTDPRPHQILEHRKFFTTNPSVYRRELCAGGWPDGAQSEGMFTHQLIADRSLRFAFWGSRNSGEWVTHIGHERAGVGY